MPLELLVPISCTFLHSLDCTALLTPGSIIAPGNGWTGGHSWTGSYTGNSPASSEVMFKITDPVNNTGI